MTGRSELRADTRIETFSSDQQDLTFRQRWASYLTILVTLVALLGAYSYQTNNLNATYPFINREKGISARYPARWLLQEEQGQTVFQVQDPAAWPFKTTIRLSLVPTGPGASPADILNLLDIDRANRLPAYRSLRRLEVDLPGGRRGIEMTYAYASVPADPFRQAELIAVRALDVVVIRTGQAVVITYESDTSSFDENRRYFDAFLRTLEY